MLSVFLLTLGLFLLIKGANWLVDGASSLALRMKIAPIVIGLTIVAFGTSAPELIISVTSAFAGNTGLALGNVLGSNIANILLILGIAAIIYPLKVQKNTVWKEIPMSFLAAFILAVLGLQNLLDRGDFPLHFLQQPAIGEISFSNGIVLLSFFVIFIYYTFGISKTSGTGDTEIKQLPKFLSILFIFLGLAGLTLGSTLTVDNAVLLARLLGVSDLFIGLTIVAIGTSLPELVTSVTAALKKNADIAVGNVVGSNIFNIFLILGTTSLVKPIPLDGQNVIDIMVLFTTTIFLFITMFFLKKHHVGRIEGIIMVTCYISYLIYLIYRG